MKVITLLTAGHIGGIETRCKDYALYSEHDNVMLILWGDGYVDEQMRKLGIKVINLQASKRNIPATIHKVMQVVRDEHADVLIAMHEAPMSHLCLMYAKKTMKKAIHTIAYATVNAVDMIHIHEKKRLHLRKAILKASLNRADDVVAISQSVKQSLLDLFHTPEDKISVIYNGTDLRRFPCTGRVYDHDKLELIYVGRLIEEKGVQDVIETLSRMPDDFHYRFRIAGDGPYKAELEQISARCGTTDTIEFLGSRDDIPELLSSSDVFIHMPRWEEGFGIAVVEAMSSGLICVCARSGAMTEILTDRVNGFLIDKGDTDKLTEVLKEISVMNPDERKRISGNAHARAGDFSIDKYVHNLDALAAK